MTNTVTTTTANTEILVIPNQDEKLQEYQRDHEASRNSLIESLETANELLEDVSALAKDSESARVYEVASSLIGQIANLNTTLLGLHEKRRSFEKTLDVDEPKTIPGNVNNESAPKTTSEMIKEIQEKKANASTP